MIRIIQIAIEFAPIIKVGGLGDMVSSLAKNLSKHHQVEVVIPYFPYISMHLPQQVLSKKTFSYFFLGKQEATAVSYQNDQLILTCIELVSQQELFNSPSVYTKDDVLKFCAFSAAATEYLYQNKPVDIIHLHDWHVGIIPGLIKSQSLTNFQPKCVFTIHNFDYQGVCNTQTLAASTISPDQLQKYTTQQDPQKANLMQGAIACSDYITTVSPSYAQEILKNTKNKELQKKLCEKSTIFSGILNGIDTTIWDPETDPALESHYSQQLLSQPQLLKKQKHRNKQALYHQLNISHSINSPCLCIISRLEEQKGLQFMKWAMLHAMENNYTFVLIGTSLNHDIQQQFANLQTVVNHSPNIRIILKYDETLARRTYAAADMICIPSLFEPCGLTQLIAMRYGTVPIARATGGLADTVIPKVNGFTFSQAQEISHTLSEALHVYFNHPKQWELLIAHGMTALFDASSMAQHYVDIYQQLSSLC